MRPLFSVGDNHLITSPLANSPPLISISLLLSVFFLYSDIYPNVEQLFAVILRPDAPKLIASSFQLYQLISSKTLSLVFPLFM